MAVMSAIVLHDGIITVLAKILLSEGSVNRERSQEKIWEVKASRSFVLLFRRNIEAEAGAGVCFRIEIFVNN